MKLSQLTSYAETKYHVREQCKRNGPPGLSALCDPETGKIAAVLMRYRDPESGTDFEYADIKCSRQCLHDLAFESYLAPPFYMKGTNWTGVRFIENTDERVVFAMFDKAMAPASDLMHFVILGANDPLKNNDAHGAKYCDTTISFDTARTSSNAAVPEKILKMRRLKNYEGSSFRSMCRTFYVQGKYMEHYEDDAPYKNCRCPLCPAYSDLTDAQLRGYFAWRANVRRGRYDPAPLAYAYIYIQELINDIGTSTPSETIQKLKELDAGYPDSAVTGNQSSPADCQKMRDALRRWTMDYVIIHNIDPEVAMACCNPEILQLDRSVIALKSPEQHCDEAVFDAICHLAGGKLSSSPVIQNFAQEGMHLFAEIWRCARANCTLNGRPLFDAIFGQLEQYPWNPFRNALYHPKKKQQDFVYTLNECHTFQYCKGEWLERCYHRLWFDKQRLIAFAHEADRMLRSYLKTKHPLRHKPDESWVTPFAEAVIGNDRKEKLEAAKPKIDICLSNLDRIRRDALLTQNSLLTDEERAESSPDAVSPDADRRASAGTAAPACGAPPDAHAACDDAATEHRPAESPSVSATLSQDMIEILRLLLDGKSAKEYIRSRHLTAAMAADALNEALLDEIGDNAVECDDELALVEEYRQEVAALLVSGIEMRAAENQDDGHHK